jgi:cell wall-associated NlpC family hydrolase
MKRDNPLFFMQSGFFSVTAAMVLSGCAGLLGGDRPPAPVEIATVTRSPAENPSPAASSRLLPPEKSKNCCQESMSNGPKYEIDSSKMELPQDRRSPDAVFMALASLGIDYRWGGRSPATGFDCSGLVAYVYRNAFAMNLPAHTEAQSRMGAPVDLAQLETGDLVFYNTLGKPNTHVGIYIGEDRFIHAPRSGASVRIENMRSSYWRTRFSGARRLVL